MPKLVSENGVIAKAAVNISGLSFRIKQFLTNKAPPRGLARLFSQRNLMAVNDEDDNQSAGRSKDKPGCLRIVSRNEPPSESTNSSLRPYT
jgi:hypothetical protein